MAVHYKTLDELVSFGEVDDFYKKFVYQVYDGEGNCLHEDVSLSEALNISDKFKRENKTVMLVRKAVEHYQIILLKESEA